MKIIATYKTELTGYKLTIGRRYMRNKNYKNVLIDSTPEFWSHVDSSSINEEKLEETSEWIRNFWDLEHSDRATNAAQYEQELNRGIYDAIAKLNARWEATFKKELNKKSKA